MFCPPVPLDIEWPNANVTKESRLFIPSRAAILHPPSRMVSHLQMVSNVAKCVPISRNFSKSHQMFPNVCKRPKIMTNVSTCFHMFPNVFKCLLSKHYIHWRDILQVEFLLLARVQRYDLRLWLVSETICDKNCFARSEGIPTLRFEFGPVFNVILDRINLRCPATFSTLRFAFALFWTQKLQIVTLNAFFNKKNISVL